MKINKIQRSFLWGAKREEKVCWISWEKMCLPKDKGYLGIKNIDIFNKALYYW